MPKKILWMVVGCLTVAALVLASCAPAVVEEEEKKPVVEEKKPVVEEKKPVVEEEEKEVGPETVTLNLTKLDGTPVTKTVEKPEYGGRIISLDSANSENFDWAGKGTYLERITQYNIYQSLNWVDWTRGLAGTGEIDLGQPYFTDKYFIPMLAESWEIVSPTELIFHLRKGIHFQDKRPAFGREVVADDWVFSLERIGRLCAGTAFVPRAGDTITATDKYTLAVKFAEQPLDLIQAMGYQLFVAPPESVDEKEDRVDWRDTCGTGPYILSDYVSATSATLKRNPNFWMYDPLFPENKLPYADEVKALYISDRATQLAALRTGKVDRLPGLKWEEALSISNTNPEILQHPAGGSGHAAWIRGDLEPYSDLRVRQALAMALDRQTILRDYFKGNATLPGAPISFDGGLGIWTPLEELPEDLQELYEYNPEKAKQLLAEAGYPNGFRVDMLVMPTPGVKDEALIVKDYWEDIGVMVDLNTPTSTGFYGAEYARNYEVDFRTYGSNRVKDLMQGAWTKYDQFSRFWGKDEEGHYNWYDAEVDELQREVAEASDDPQKRFELMNELNILIMSRQYAIEMPRAVNFNCWQPWLKGYQGESQLAQTMSSTGIFWLCWVDQDLKEALIGKR